MASLRSWAVPWPEEPAGATPTLGLLLRPGHFLKNCLYSGNLLLSDAEGHADILPGPYWDLAMLHPGRPRLDLPCPQLVC